MSMLPLAAVPPSKPLRVAPCRLVLNTQPAASSEGVWVVVRVAWYYGKSMLTEWKESVASRVLIGVNAGAVGSHGACHT
jgi:hypothetical protein